MINHYNFDGSGDRSVMMEVVVRDDDHLLSFLPAPRQQHGCMMMGGT
jgi:hypothetical protein